MEQIIVDKLLQEVYKLKKHYDEISELSGENFNVFKILGLYCDEASHSKFIAMLLDPKAEHKKGNIFLKLFLEEINIDFGSKNFQNVKVETEKHLGSIKGNYEMGGRVDIAIKIGEQNIVIENKIYAYDQRNQLRRYSNYSPETKIVYLTLDGKEPSDYEKLQDLLEMNRLYLVSYSDDILNWLEKCKKESVGFPLLRETIAQYIFLIKDLTGKSRSKDMENELLNTLMENKENVKAAFLIADNKTELKKRIIEENVKPCIQELAKKHELNCEICLSDNIFSGFDFFKSDWKHFKIRFEFEKYGFQDLIYGFCGIKSRDISKWELIYNHFKNIAEKNNYKKPTVGWPLHRYSRYKNWGDVEFLELFNGKLKDFIEPELKELLDLVEEIDKDLEL